uniref:Uncharacterized protein n=1 Tax=viral metagenome TaxID=1070528 RepID=A0A6C0KV57_9ZZZZ
MYSAQGQPEVRHGPPLPPYNTLNFNSNSPFIFNTLQGIALTSPNYPLPTSADANQIADNKANVTYYNSINQQASTIRGQNRTFNSPQPYPQFGSESERLKYRQGLASASARTLFTGKNPAAPAGPPVSTIYQIINS